MSLLDAAISAALNLLIGGFGIYVGGRLITGERNYEHAVWTALIGSVVWFLTAWLFAGVPGLGPLLVLVAYVGVINWRYPGGWVNAAGIALFAWLASVATLWVLARLGIAGIDATGIPGT